MNDWMNDGSGWAARNAVWGRQVWNYKIKIRTANTVTTHYNQRYPLPAAWWTMSSVSEWVLSTTGRISLIWIGDKRHNKNSRISQSELSTFSSSCSGPGIGGDNLVPLPGLLLFTDLVSRDDCLSSLSTGHGLLVLLDLSTVHWWNSLSPL